MLYFLGTESTKFLYMHSVSLKTQLRISMYLSVLVDWSQVSWQLTGLNPEDVSSVVVLRMGKRIIAAC